MQESYIRKNPMSKSSCDLAPKVAFVRQMKGLADEAFSAKGPCITLRLDNPPRLRESRMVQGRSARLGPFADKELEG